MSSSESDDRDLEENDEDSLCKYGTQLPQYEADEIPSKKPLQVEDMVVKDENGRRRFHGAFTGGFSAGYWNTVGSKEGFTPSEFKSSRNEKASAKVFKPTDFMDDEDFGEFGIAPQKIQTKDDFGASTSSAKRKREKPSDGPIPGEPVLKNLLKPVHDKAAVRILKKMGYRYGQGIGSRMTYSEKKRTAERNKRELYVSSKYGGDGSDEDDDMSDDEITFVPDDFDPFIANIKDNTFGLEYSGLRPTEPTSTQRFSLFEPFKVFGGKDNKKFSISGQAFGVGALEEEDDDIYGADNDMSKYDFVLDNTSEKRGNSRNVSKPIDASIIEGFSKATINDSTVRTYTVDIPRDYEPRNWFQRKSRFAPLSKEKVKVLEEQNKHKILGLGRHDLNPEQRGALINEPEKPPNILQKDDDEEKKKKSQEASKKMMELLNSKQFVSENSTNKEGFKPFIANPDKQDRYEKFLALKTTNEAEIEKFFNDIQPLSMSRFDSEMERKEFVQAKRMYQPLDSLMGNRFIKEADIQKEPDVKTAIKDGKEVVVIQRTIVMWKPHKTLCKLFNIPEPYGGMMFDEEEEKKKNKKKQSLFEYIGVPLNTKANFVAPQVIPRKLSEDRNRRDPEDEKRKSFLAAVEKEKSFMGQRATAKDFFDEPMLPSSSQTDKEMPKDNKMEKKEVKKVSNEQPKTELEMKVAESIHKKPEEKKDLFKAIFCDSDDDDEEKDDDSAEAIKISNADASEGTSTLTEKQKSTFIESFLSTKSASEINVLRNKSPPRGIFKSIFELGTSTSKALSNERQKEGNVEDVVEEEAYGPALPQNFINTKYSSDDSSSSSESSLDEKLLKKLKKVKSSNKEERWVEKDKVKKSKKHHKKKKSHKKSHKKHKSKK